MYVIIDKLTDSAYVFKEKTQIALFLNISRNTISNNQHKGIYVRGNFTLYYNAAPPKKSKRGGKYEKKQLKKDNSDY